MMPSSQHSLSVNFVRDLADLHNRIDEATLKKARDCLLDFLGVTLGGARDLQAKHQAILNSLTSPTVSFTVLGSQAKADLLTAALLNGMSAHQLELDDGHRYGMVHPGATVIAALLPLAQATNADDVALLRSIVVGYEAAIRVAMAVQPGMKHRGYHATGTCGAIGAAMGAGFLLGQDQKAIHTTLCVAATQSSGLLQVIRGGSDLKPFNAGQAALHGLLAATMGGAGFCGPSDVFAGEQGLLQILSVHPDPYQLDGVNKKIPAIHGIYVKPYASCRHCHPAIEAALALRKTESFNLAEVYSVRVETYGLAVHLHDHRQVANSADARMSTPYSVAAALRFGAADMDQFTAEALIDSDLMRICHSVEVVEDPTFTARVPHERGARVTIAFKSGRSIQHTVPLPKGEPENPIEPAEHLAKFRGLASYAGLDEHRIDDIISYVRGGKKGIAQLCATL